MPPIGWLGYVGWVGYRTGDLLGYFAVADRWGNGFDGGIAFSRWVWGYLTGPDVLLGLLLCAGVVVLLGLLALCVRGRLPLPLLVFAGVLVLLALTTSGYFGSRPRYLLPAFPLLIPVAVALARLRTAHVVTVLGAMVAGSAVYGAFWLLGPGPP